MAGKAISRCTNCCKLNRVPVVAKGTPRCGVCQTPLPWIVDADAASFDAAIDTSKPMVIDFWADWCAPCRMVTPIVGRLAGEFAGRLKVVKLDTEAAPQIAARYGVQGIPLPVLLRDDQELDRVVGARPEPELRSWLEGQLAAGSARA